MLTNLPVNRNQLLLTMFGNRIIMQSSNRLQHIDSLRGFAALYVILFHLPLIPNPHLSVPPFLSKLIFFGDSGVTLFFVISAFTLCYTIDNAQDQSFPTLRFYIRRIARIFPLYYFWLALMIGVSLWTNRQNINYTLDTIPLLTFSYNFIPGMQEGLVWASWTLGIEVIFYIFFPFIFRFTRNIRNALIFLACTLALALIHYHLITSFNIVGLKVSSLNHKGYNIYISFFHQIPVFAIGIVMYYIYTKYFKVINFNRYLGIPVIIAGLTILCFTALFKSHMLVFYCYPASVGYAILITGLSIFPTKLLINRFSVYFGLISYSLYLNHPKIIYGLSHVYKKIYSITNHSLMSYTLCALISIVIISTASTITYYFLEKPGGLIIKKRLSCFLK